MKPSLVSEKRRRDLAQIHMAIKALGLDRPTYERILGQIQKGCRSSAYLSPSAREELLDRLIKMGWVRKRKERSKPTTPQEKMIVALWLTLHKQGVVADPGAKALNKFIKRQAGVDSLHWLSVEAARGVIESLKAWLKRTHMEQRDGRKN